jgi:hypothetical protein
MRNRWGDGIQQTASFIGQRDVFTDIQHILSEMKVYGKTVMTSAGS